VLVRPRPAMRPDMPARCEMQIWIAGVLALACMACRPPPPATESSAQPPIPKSASASALPRTRPPPTPPPSPLPLDGRLELVSKWSTPWNWADDDNRFDLIAVGYGWVLVEDGTNLSLLDADTGEVVTQRESCKAPRNESLIEGAPRALLVMNELEAVGICGNSFSTRSLPDLYGTVTASWHPSPDEVALTNGLVAYSSTINTNYRRPPYFRSKLTIEGDVDATFDLDDKISGLVFSPNRQLLIVQQREALSVLNIATGDWRDLPRERRFLHALSLSPDNEHLFGFDSRGGVQIVALDTYELIYQYPRDVRRMVDSIWLNNETVVATTLPGLFVFRLGEEKPEIHERPLRGYVLAASLRDRMVCLGGETLECWDIVPVGELVPANEQ
jgi:hypothetical protein